MANKIPITVAEGDGIGPEIMSAVLHILKESGADLDIHLVEIGEKVYLRGEPAGIEASTWDTIRNTKAFLKAPITTPQGGGFKSLNVTVRTSLGLYANIRPCVAYSPYIDTKHPGMDVVVVRENEEDLYTGIEYRHSSDTVQALKIISRPGCEKIVRYAFEYAKANGRKKVTCFTKDNILKLSDGLFHEVFEEIAKEYSDIENEHWIIDIGAAKLADTPNIFDVVVMPNLYGDILSDIAAQIAGSVGLAGSANIGQHGAMFEAIHGSAPRRAGQNLANPSGLLLGSVMMLVHLGLIDSATDVHNAWLKTIEDGIHTYDIFKEGISKEKVGTKEFGRAVAQRLGQKPEQLKAAHYAGTPKQIHYTGSSNQSAAVNSKKEILGVDVFLDCREGVEHVKQKMDSIAGDLRLSLIGNRGARVWPNTMAETFCIDQWRCRFMSQDKGAAINRRQIANLVKRLADADIDFTQMECLCSFDGKPGFTLAQDEQ
jgi:isocitrate dehydrogenase